MQSSQFENGKYYNQINWQEPAFHDFLSLMKEMLIEDVERTPKKALPLQSVDLTAFNSTVEEQLNATWLGHSSLLLNIDGNKIITDPVYEKRISLFGPTRYNGEVPLKIADLPEIDVVIISHNHYDHLNKYSIQKIKDKANLFITTLGIAKTLIEWGVSHEKVIELDWWQEYRVNEKLLIAATPAQHFSGRALTDRFKTLWASWVIHGSQHNIFYSGDSGYFPGFKQIGDKYGPFDMTFMENGAYNRRWRAVHMFPEECLQAHLDVRGKILHPIHWGTFRLSTHSWYDPIQRLCAAAENAGVPLATPKVGETTIYPTQIPNSKWWESLISENGKLK
ncbi:MAG: MBL fold metallo-hydrolase [Deferribacteres bacterium]|nr:MBL fold metallo-hydrolase [candidate division KSB1 bacterium]MCB9504315.1 MBL fold metallo-hydrolase [Deferribacteres bacterium]